MENSKIRKYREWKIHQLGAKVNGQMQLLFFPERTFTFRKLHLSHSILHSLGMMLMMSIMVMVKMMSMIVMMKMMIIIISLGNIIFRLNFALLVTESHYSHPRHLTVYCWKSKQHDF